MNLGSFLRVTLFYTYNKPNYSSSHVEGEKIGFRWQKEKRRIIF